MSGNISYAIKTTNEFSKTEVRLLVGVIFSQGPITPSNEAEIFQKMTAALEGRRILDKVKFWYYNAKRILEHEKRFTVLLESALNADEKEKLTEMMLFKELTRKRKFEEEDFDYELVKEEEKNDENDPSPCFKSLRLGK